MALKRREYPVRMSMTMVALLRWAALMDEAEELRGLDRAQGPGSEAGRNVVSRLSVSH